MPTALAHPAVQRVLDVAARKGVTLEVMTFPDSTHTAADAARVVGAEIGQIVKSLVFETAAAGGISIEGGGAISALNEKLALDLSGIGLRTLFRQGGRNEHVARKG